MLERLPPLPCVAWLVCGALGCAPGDGTGATGEPPSLKEAIPLCTAQAEMRDPSLEVHRMGAATVALGGRLLGVAVDIPEDPALEACLRSMPRRGVRALGLDEEVLPESVGVGGFGVDVGEGERPRPSPEEMAAGLARHRARTRALVSQLVASGELPGDNPVIQEVLADPPQDDTPLP